MLRRSSVVLLGCVFLISCSGGASRESGIVDPRTAMGDHSWMSQAATATETAPTSSRSREIPYNLNGWTDFSQLPTMAECKAECFEIGETEDGKSVLIALEDPPEDPCEACWEHVAFEVDGMTIYWHELTGMGMNQGGTLSPALSACFPNSQMGGSASTFPWNRRSMAYQSGLGAGYLPYQSQAMGSLGAPMSYPCEQGMGDWARMKAVGQLLYDLDQSFYAIESGAPPEQVFYELEDRNVSRRMDEWGTPSMGELLSGLLSSLKMAGEGTLKSAAYSFTMPMKQMAYRTMAAGQYSAWAMKNQFSRTGYQLGYMLNGARFYSPGMCNQRGYQMVQNPMCGSGYLRY